MLTFVGPIGTYGIKTVELRHRPGEQARTISLARYRSPDSILLFEQPTPPWVLPGRLNEATAVRLHRAGALIDLAEMTTVIDWPDDSLSLFMAFDGLLHEIGHHVIQQYEGKRNIRKKRTADHERRADAFALACRKAWTDEAGR